MYRLQIMLLRLQASQLVLQLSQPVLSLVLRPNGFELILVVSLSFVFDGGNFLLLLSHHSLQVDQLLVVAESILLCLVVVSDLDNE